MYTVEPTLNGKWWVVHPEIAEQVALCIKEADARRIARALNIEAAIPDAVALLRKLSDDAGGDPMNISHAAAKALRAMGVDVAWKWGHF